MRNEVFARHGYIFKSPLLVAHFSEMSRCHDEFLAAATRLDVKALERMAEFPFYDGFQHAVGPDAEMFMSKEAIDRITHVGRPAFRKLMGRLLDDVVVDALKNTVVPGVRGHGMSSSAMSKPWGYPIFQLDFGAGGCVLTGVDVGASADARPGSHSPMRARSRARWTLSW